jgi:hypothetical protein
MDHRHTEDYARRMEAAQLRAHALRQEAITQFWRAAGAWLLRAIRGGTGRRRGNVTSLRSGAR